MSYRESSSLGGGGGTRGEDGKQQLKRVALRDMSTEHIKNVLLNCSAYLDEYIIELFKNELEYRKGEIIGEGLNGNQYKTSLDFLVFNIYCTKSKSYVSAEVRKDICAALNLKHVPVLQLQTSGLSVQEMLEQADGESLLNGSKREGYVIKSKTDTGLIIKVVSNLWLYSTGN